MSRAWDKVKIRVPREDWNPASSNYRSDAQPTELQGPRWRARPFTRFICPHRTLSTLLILAVCGTRFTYEPSKWPGGDSNIKKGGGARRLAKGVEEKSPIFLAFKVSLRVSREEMQHFFKKNSPRLVSIMGQKLREPRPDWSPLGVNFKILNEHPHLFLYSSPPPPPGVNGLARQRGPCSSVGRASDRQSELAGCESSRGTQTFYLSHARNSSTTNELKSFFIR